jgi:general L-amino acid transport system permease protein
MAVIALLRRHLFSSIFNTLLTIVTAALLGVVIVQIGRWAILTATVSGSSQAACIGGGACWTFIRLRLPVLLFGHYPPEEAWRLAIAAALLLSLFGMPALPAVLRRRGLWLIVPALFLSAAGVLLIGGMAGLPPVDTDQWGGLMLNVVVTVLVTILALPFGVILALGRQSPLPVLRSLSVCYIEFWRGLPLLAVLFVSAVMAPLFMPHGVSVSRLVRAVVAMGLFNAAYMAEIVRGGLQALDIGQDEAAASLGLRPWQSDLLIRLPQALRQSIPGLVNTVIDLFKDTTLLSIIGLYELLGSVSQSLRDPAWLGLSEEGFTFAAGVFFVCCFAISLYTRRLERRPGRQR